MLYLLDYGAGNVRSLANTLDKLGFDYKWVQNVQDIERADKIIFPGVGAFGSAMTSLRKKGFVQPLQQYIASGRPFMGICIGMQTLLQGSEESDEPGLAVVPARCRKFNSKGKKVPHMGWNGAVSLRKSDTSTITDDYLRYGFEDSLSYYFVHSFQVPFTKDLSDWSLTVSQYGDEVFVSSLQKDNVFATQFHPEKSGQAGLNVLHAWLSQDGVISKSIPTSLSLDDVRLLLKKNGFTKRIVACLDVRSNDSGDLVVTKGDQYDVREVNGHRDVRNLGKPVELAQRYYAERADEIAFLNITSFRSCPLQDQPMLEVLRQAAETIYVPLTIGGGIRDTTDPDGTARPALEVAGAYFRAGADKVSIGSDAVLAVEALLAADNKLSGQTAIETISVAYGAQAVVVSVDPKRVYVDQPEDAGVHQSTIVDLSDSQGKPEQGPAGQRYCWYQCTVKGGREARDLDVVQLAQGVEALGAGEILLNSVDRDGSKAGFDLRLVSLVARAVSIPVIASSGAGKPQDFTEVFNATGVEAALAAGIFHRKEVPLADVKSCLALAGIPIRIDLSSP